MSNVGPRADLFRDGDFEFALFRDEKGGKGLDVFSYLGNSKDIIIPDHAVDPSGNSHPVVSIGRMQCSFPRGLRTIVLPDTIHIIARIECPTLESVIVPDSVTEIGPAAFAGCRGLKNISIPSRVERINPYTFDGCSSLVTLLIPPSVRTIAKFAFRACSSLKHIIIPDNVREVGRYAFYSCTSLRAVAIGSGLKTIHADMFEGCNALQSVKIGSGVRDIGENAFINMVNLKTVVFSEGLKRIGKRAFEGCTSLETITLPESVTSLDYTSFLRCLSLKEIFVRHGNTKYASSYGCLYDVKGTKLLICPAGMEGTFDVPDHVTTIDEGAFCYCNRLNYVVIPDNVKSIGFNAFYGCSSLKSVSIGKGVKILNGSTFEFCSSLSWVEMSNGVKVISDHAFGSCTSLKRIDLPDSVQHIDKYAFYNCENLQSIKLGKNLSVIAPYAFLGCPSLVEVLLHEDNMYFTVHDGALYTRDLKELVYYPSAKKGSVFRIPKSTSVIRMGSLLGPKSLIAYVVDGENEHFDTVDGVLFSKDRTELLRYPAGMGRSYSIPYGVQYVGEDAFFGCALRNVVVPDGVKSIGVYAFYGCSHLTSVSLPGTLYALLDYCFSKCTSLKKVYVRDRVGSLLIGHGTFALCNHDMRILSDVSGYRLDVFGLKGKEEYDIPEGELTYFTGTLGLDWVSTEYDY